jgi:CheY-like chemotaxis protein
MLDRLLKPSFRLAGHRLLLLDAPSLDRDRLTSALRNEGADVVACSSAWEALLALQLSDFAAVVARLELAPRGGRWLLERARVEAEAFPESARVDFVALTDDASPPAAARARRVGFAAVQACAEPPEALIAKLADVLSSVAPGGVSQRPPRARLSEYPPL